jgi:pilus assembly protein Flp/PilA
MIAYYMSNFQTHPIKTVNNINDNRKMNKMVKFLRDEEGATAVEYAIMASGIAVVITLTVFLLGIGVNELFERFITEWKTHVKI